MPGEVFVSYSHTDGDYVRQLVRFLKAKGFDVRIDKGIDIGSQWITVVRGKVDNCAAFIPVMTYKADESTWVARELERADAFGRPILPLLLDGQPLASIGGIQYDDVRGGLMPSQRFLDRLAAVVERHDAAVTGRHDHAQDQFDVILDAHGGKKIQVIRVVRELTGLHLKEAKDLVEATPKTVLSRVGKENANRAKTSLEEQGAKVTLR